MHTRLQLQIGSIIEVTTKSWAMKKSVALHLKWMTVTKYPSEDVTEISRWLKVRSAEW